MTEPPVAPLPAQGPPPRESFARQAAKASVFSPLIIVLAMWFIPTATSTGVAVVQAALVVLLGLAGILGGLIGVVSAMRGESGLWGKSVFGLFANGAIVLAVMAIAVSSALETQRSNQEMVRLGRDIDAIGEKRLREMTVENLSEVSLQSLEEMNALLAASGDDLIGVDKDSFEALKAFLARFGEFMAEYEKVQAPIMEDDFFDNTKLQTRQDVLLRLDQSRAFLDVCERFRDATVNAEQLMESELRKREVPERATKVMMDGFRTNTRTYELSAKVREQDVRMGAALIGMFEVLLEHEGAWEVDLESGELLFETNEVLDAYNAHFETLETAGAVQLEAQEALVAHQREQAAQKERTQ